MAGLLETVNQMLLTNMKYLQVTSVTNFLMMDTVFIYDTDCLFVVGMHALGLHMLRGDPDTLYDHNFNI